ncbi:Protein of unknown function [Pyronema omphalodes CBS 100304]|uniref:Uncharacterized protein n=1 Tax=Pyronema omphalodes (strain CBS 100304) TaxID=1076935 RepID=U4L8M7_PYROM|nr:Protein of unknown function [Pyronema omphalodes CBS 100304]
MGRGKSLI